MKRLFDILSASIGIIFCFPIFIIISIAITLDSRGGILYKQIRVGKYGTDFFLYKFRTMRINSDKLGLLTIGSNDTRITKIGNILRKYKLDELPQLFNVLFGSMSIVGPRPEVRKYVELYDEKQKTVLNVKPGITDYASILYSSENELLGNADNPEKLYIEKIMPDKLLLNFKYINEQSFFTDVKIIAFTILKILKQK